jgi:hypothetical protein
MQKVGGLGKGGWAVRTSAGRSDHMIRQSKFQLHEFLSSHHNNEGQGTFLLLQINLVLSKTGENHNEHFAALTSQSKHVRIGLNLLHFEYPVL